MVCGITHKYHISGITQNYHLSGITQKYHLSGITQKYHLSGITQSIIYMGSHTSIIYMGSHTGIIYLVLHTRIIYLFYFRNLSCGRSRVVNFSKGRGKLYSFLPNNIYRTIPTIIRQLFNQTEIKKNQQTRKTVYIVVCYSDTGSDCLNFIKQHVCHHYSSKMYTYLAHNI